MNKRTRTKMLHFGFSVLLSLIFFVAGSRMLYADFRRTTTVTTTAAPTMTAPQVTVQPAVVTEPAVVTTQPAVVTERTVVPAAVSVQQVHDYITYDIDVKNIFQSNELVHGQVIVNNSSNVPLSDNFNVKLYHNGKLVKELLTRLTGIAPGQTRYSLESFGIPQINDTTASQGDWTISIYDTDPAYSRTADLRIINSTGSNNLLR